MESDDFNRIIKDKTSSSILQKEDDNVSEKEDTYKFTDTFFTEKAVSITDPEFLNVAIP